MKTLPKLLAVALTLAALAGCRSTGYNENALNNSLTPNVAQKGYVRTYDSNGNPTVSPAPIQGTSDPASPTYHAPGGAN
jgi:hypothetical protein